MGKPFSMDLRIRALAAMDSGMSDRTAAERFDVAPAEDHPFRQPGEPAPDLNARPSDAQVHQVAMSMEAKSA